MHIQDRSLCCFKNDLHEHLWKNTVVGICWENLRNYGRNLSTKKNIKHFCEALQSCGKTLKHSCVTALKDTFGRLSSDTLLQTIYVRNPCRRLLRDTVRCTSARNCSCTSLSDTLARNSDEPLIVIGIFLVNSCTIQTRTLSVTNNFCACRTKWHIPCHILFTKYCAPLVFLTGSIL